MPNISGYDCARLEIFRHATAPRIINPYADNLANRIEYLAFFKLTLPDF